MSSVKGSRVVLLAGLFCCVFLVPGCPNTIGLSCPNGLQFCSNSCVFVATDTKNCGKCGVSCPATLACVNGACGCPQGLTRCGNSCVDTKNDPANCGKCSNACAGSLDCIAGSCGCAAGFTACNNACANTATDQANCGTCNNNCGAKVCSASQCTTTCGPGLTNCSGSCVDINNDPRNCGACNNPCGSNFFCSNATCTLQCPSNLMRCGAGANQYCADITTDENNCGGCGTICPAMGDPSGASGSPTPPQMCCSSQCVQVNTLQHCGSCMPCPNVNGEACAPLGGASAPPDSPLFCQNLG